MILFVRLADKVKLDDDLKRKLSQAIREGATLDMCPMPLLPCQIYREQGQVKLPNWLFVI